MTTAWGGVLPDDNSQGRGDSFYYLLAAGAGVLAGWVDIKISDLLFTALLVMVPAMLLGFLRPSKPWRWAVLVGVFVPFVELLAYLFLKTQPYRAQVFQSFLALLPALVAAYGGAFGRGVINNLRGSK
jgi:hypothetical protein